MHVNATPHHAHREARLAAAAAVVSSWRDHTRQRAAAARRTQLLRILLAWAQHSTAQQEWLAASLAWAGRRHSRRQLGLAFGGWHRQSQHALQTAHSFAANKRLARLQHVWQVSTDSRVEQHLHLPA
jgi:hypothetical protein